MPLTVNDINKIYERYIKPAEEEDRKRHRRMLNWLTRREAMEREVDLCESCDGDGCVLGEDGEDMTCPDCDGTGEQVEERESNVES